MSKISPIDSSLWATSFLSFRKGVGLTCENMTLGTFLLTKFSSSWSIGSLARVGSEKDQSSIFFFNSMSADFEKCLGRDGQVCLGDALQVAMDEVMAA